MGAAGSGLGAPWHGEGVAGDVLLSAAPGTAVCAVLLTHPARHLSR